MFQFKGRWQSLSIRERLLSYFLMVTLGFFLLYGLGWSALSDYKKQSEALLNQQQSNYLWLQENKGLFSKDSPLNKISDMASKRVFLLTALKSSGVILDEQSLAITANNGLINIDIEKVSAKRVLTFIKDIEEQGIVISSVKMKRLSNDMASLSLSVISS